MNRPKNHHVNELGQDNAVFTADPYPDSAAARRADGAVRLQVGARMDAMLGLLAWIRTEQAKLGGQRHFEDIDAVSDIMEGVSRNLESASDVVIANLEGQPRERELLAGLRANHLRLMELAARLDQALGALAERRAAAEPGEMNAMKILLGEMEEGLRERERLTRGSGRDSGELY